MTVISNENFDAGATGWNNNTTRTVGGERILGRFSGSLDAEKTFAVSQDVAGYLITFDFYELDSWDNEEFYVYVDGKAVNLGRFSHGSDESENQKSGTSADDISWSYSSGARQYLSNTQHWADQIHSVTLWVPQGVVTGDELTLRFDARINSGMGDESYGIDNVVIATQQTRIVASEGFEGGANGWSINNTRVVGEGDEQILGRFTGAQDVEKTFSVPTGADSYTVSFDFYELDSWDNEEFYVYVDGKAINLGRFSHGTNENENIKSGVTADEIAWSYTSAPREYLSNTAGWYDQVHNVTLIVPRTALTGSDITVKFDARLNSGENDESYGIDNLIIMANTVAAPAPARDDLIDFFREDFENGALGWSNNNTDALSGVGKVLGRFDGSQDVSKTFDVPADVEGYNISFDFLELDSWDNESFFVYVDNKPVDLGSFHVYSNEVNDDNSGITGDGIEWVRASSTREQISGTAGSSNWTDQIHHINLWVPRDAVSGNQMTVRFDARINSGVSDESYAIDNFVIATERTGRSDQVQEFIDLYAEQTYDDIAHLLDWQIDIIIEYVDGRLENIQDFRALWSVYQDSQMYIDEISSERNLSEALVLAELNNQVNGFDSDSHIQMRDYLDLNVPDWGLYFWYLSGAVGNIDKDKNEAEVESILSILLNPVYSDLVMYEDDLATSTIDNKAALNDAGDLDWVYGYVKGNSIIDKIADLTLPNFQQDVLASFTNDITQEIDNLVAASNSLSRWLEPDPQSRPGVTIEQELGLVSNVELLSMLDHIRTSFDSMHKLDDWSDMLLNSVADEITSDFTSANLASGVGAGLYLMGGGAFLGALATSAVAINPFVAAGSIAYFVGSAVASGSSVKGYADADFGLAKIEYDLPSFNLDGIAAVDSFNYIIQEAEDRYALNEANVALVESGVYPANRVDLIEITSEIAADAVTKFTDTSMFLMVLEGALSIDIDRGSGGTRAHRENDLIRRLYDKTKKMDDFLEDSFDVKVDWATGEHGFPHADQWNGLGDWHEEATDRNVNIETTDPSGDNLVGFRARISDGFLGDNTLYVDWHRDTDWGGRFDAVQNFDLTDVWMF
jgi:hypothetical protein